MNWLTLTLISVFITSFANILAKVIMKHEKSDPYSYAIVFHFLVAAVSLFFAILHGFHFPTTNNNLLFFPIAAALWGSGTVFLYKALQLIEASEATIISTFKGAVTIAASVIFLHESFGGQKILGFLIIVAAIFLVTNLKHKVKVNKGVLYALLMTIFYGSAVIFDVLIIRNYDPISYLAVSNCLIGIILFIIKPKALLKNKAMLRSDFLKKMAALAIFSSVQAIAYYVALTIGQASQISAVNQSQTIATVLLAVILLKERDNLPRKLASAVLVTIGVFLLR